MPDLKNNTPNPETNIGENQQANPDGGNNGNGQNQNQTPPDGKENQGGENKGVGEGQGSPENKGSENAGSGDDYKTKFSESTRENQRLMELLKAQGIDPKTGKPIQESGSETGDNEFAGRGAERFNNETTQLTDEELAQAIPGFAYLDESEKAVIRNVKNTAKQMAAMQKIVSELYDERVFNREIKKILKDEKFAPIKDKLDEFTDYAYEDNNRNIPLDKLANLFLIEKGLLQKEADNKPPKRSGVESGGSGKGEAQPVDKDEYTAEEVAKMRVNDPRRYQKLVISGKLKIK